MGISYKKLWKLMIDRDMLKKDLRESCALSTASMAKLAKNRNLNTDILVRVCNFLRCDISDICEVILDSAGDEKDS
jgi:DNA-binding Xre family transcriptional regulator